MSDNLKNGPKIIFVKNHLLLNVKFTIISFRSLRRYKNALSFFRLRQRDNFLRRNFVWNSHLQGSRQKTSYETLRSTSDQCFHSRLTMKHFIPNTTKNLAQKKVNLDVLKSGQKLRKRSLRESFNMNFFKLWKLRRERVSTFHCWLEILYRLFLMKCKE